MHVCFAARICGCQSDAHASIGAARCTADASSGHISVDGVVQAAEAELSALKQGLRHDQQRLARAHAQRDAAVAAARAAEDELAFYTAHVLGVEEVSSEKMAAELTRLRAQHAARRSEVAAARAQMAGRRALQDG